MLLQSANWLKLSRKEKTRQVSLPGFRVRSSPEGDTLL
jgi:hypothetical protein